MFLVTFAKYCFSVNDPGSIFSMKQQIRAFFHGKSTAHSLKFASGITTMGAGEKDGKEWINT